MSFVTPIRSLKVDNLGKLTQASMIKGYKNQ